MRKSRQLFTFTFVTISSFILLSVAGCGDKGLRGLKNQELAGKRDECVMNNPTAPGRVTACENIKKECERRRKEGNYAC